MPISRLTEYLPPELVYVREPLAEEENAWGSWMEALEYAAIPDEEDETFWRLHFGDEETGERVDFPEGAEADAIRRILAENNRAFGLIDEGLRRGRAQVPEPTEGEDVDAGCAGFKLSLIHHVRSVRAKGAAAAGDLRAAAADYSAIYRAGEMMCRGEGDFVCYLSGFRDRGDGLNGIRRIAADERAGRELLEELSGLIGSGRPDTDGILTSQSVGLSYTILNELDSIPEGGDREATVDELLNLYYADEPLAWSVSEECGVKEPRTAEEISDLRQRLWWRRERILFLIENHPEPFDKVETVRLLGRYCLRLFDVFRQAMCGEDVNIDVRTDLGLEEMDAWSMLLQPHVPCELLGEGPPMAGFAADQFRRIMGDSTWNEAFPPVPTACEWTEARNRLSRARNPIGKLIVMHLANSRGRRLLLGYYRDRRDTQTLLAKRLGREC